MITHGLFGGSPACDVVGNAMEKNQNENPDPRDARIKELETQLMAVEKTHAFQAERADKLEADLKVANEKLLLQKKRADKLMADISAKAASEQTKDQKPAGEALSQGNVVFFRGVAYPIIGDFRADNTFAEVKRGHCPEGVTLVAIDRPH